MKRISRLLLATVAALVVIAPAADAKILTGRVGAGFNSQFQAAFVGPGAGQIATNHSLSAKYWVTDAIGVQWLGGFSVFEDGKHTQMYYVNTGGKFLYNLIQEENMNFYLAAGAGVIFAGFDDGDDYQHDFGFNIFPGGGFEWFFAGLPNLGFSAELGFQYLHLDARNDFGTYGGAFGQVGVHYYF